MEQPSARFQALSSKLFGFNVAIIIHTPIAAHVALLPVGMPGDARTKLSIH